MGVEEHRLRCLARFAVKVQSAVLLPGLVFGVLDVLRHRDLVLGVIEHLFLVLRLVQHEVHRPEDEVPGGDVVVDLFERLRIP